MACRRGGVSAARPRGGGVVTMVCRWAVQRGQNKDQRQRSMQKQIRRRWYHGPCTTISQKSGGGGGRRIQGPGLAPNSRLTGPDHDQLNCPKSAKGGEGGGAHPDRGGPSPPRPQRVCIIESPQHSTTMITHEMDGVQKARCSTSLILFFGSALGKLAKPSYQTVLERVLGVRNQSSPVLRWSHGSVR